MRGRSGREAQLLCLVHNPSGGPEILPLDPSGRVEGKRTALSPTDWLEFRRCFLCCDCFYDSLKTRRPGEEEEEPSQNLLTLTGVIPPFIKDRHADN